MRVLHETGKPCPPGWLIAGVRYLVPRTYRIEATGRGLEGARGSRAFLVAHRYELRRPTVGCLTKP
jgi:hypothetical protein